MEQLKKEYNTCISRINKAHQFFMDNPDKCDGKYLDEYQKLLKRCSELYKEYKVIAGENMDSENILEGFK